MGKPVKDIICSGLPTKLNVLKTLMYYHLEECKTVDESAKLAIQSTLTYWEKAHIPVQRHDSCKRQLKKLYDQYCLLKKNRLKSSYFLRAKEQMFLDDLQSLFDISTKDAIETMKNEQDKAFLAMQREDTSSCSMSSVDKISAEREIRKQKRLHKEEQRKRKYAKEQMQENKTPMLSDATETNEGSDSDNEENNVPVPSSLPARKKNKRKIHMK